MPTTWATSTRKNTTRTRTGTKDELLRLVAVLHANGIEVVEDAVLNHVDGAGTGSGAGGLDPSSFSTSANAGFKNFRYASWASPVPAADNAAAYLARSGRWPKNFTNFHAHAGHNSTSGDFAITAFGPDFCYGDDGGSDGYGPSTNATYNPPQAAGYSRTQARQWLQWLKKQTGVDGFRWDAVKNYGYAPQQDWLYNLKYLTGFASGGEAMLSTGEFVGSKAELDTYCLAVNSRNGGSEFAMGTFDFGLRGAMYNMVAGGGNYDLGRVPAEQQDQRVAYYPGSNTYVHRTAPFVNSHDTFRPTFNAAGNYTGWNTSQELAAHIEPNDVRLSAAYAIALAVDGNPHIYFEDLFNLGYLGNRFTHLPADAAALPVRADVANLIWCHQHLNFKGGAYFVRWQSPDHLVIERGGRALIGINDNFTTWQANTVTTSFPQGTLLKDYSGANGAMTVTVGAGGQVGIRTAPCNGTAALGRRGYSVWAPVGQDNSTYTPPRAARTTQEWELADDLGDSNCRSLGQGGRLPDNSTTWRLTGRIFARGGRPVNYLLYPENNATNANALDITLFDAVGTAVSTATGTRSITGAYTPPADGWLTIKVRNATATQPGQKAYANITYEAPASTNTRLPANAPVPNVAVWNGAAGTPDVLDCRNYEAGITPNFFTEVRISGTAPVMPVVAAGATFAAARLTLEPGSTLTVPRTATVELYGDLIQNGTLAGDGRWQFLGLARTPQLITGTGPLTFSKIDINNDSADVALGANLTVRDSLYLSKARLVLGAFNLNLATARVFGGAAGSYVLSPNTPANGGLCRAGRNAAGTRFFPIGTASGYAPLTASTPYPTDARVYDGLFTFGPGAPAAGQPYAAANQGVQRTWVLSSGYGPNPFTATVTPQWNAPDEGPLFNRASAAAYLIRPLSSMPGQWQAVPPAGPASGSGPYQFTANALSDGLLSVGNATLLAARPGTGPVLLTLSPNPSTGPVRLTVAGTVSVLTLRLTSVLGQVVAMPVSGTLAQVQAQLNAVLATAAPGVYVLVVQANGHTQHLRLVRE